MNITDIMFIIFMAIGVILGIFIIACWIDHQKYLKKCKEEGVFCYFFGPVPKDFLKEDQEK